MTVALLAWLLLAASPGSPEAARLKVVGVEIRMPPGSHPEGLVRLVAVRKGQPLSKRSVRRSLEALFATGKLSDAVARAIPEPGGVEVIFDLTPVRVLTAITFRGSEVFSRSELLELSGLSDGTDADPERIRKAVARLEHAYGRRGYERADVEVTLEKDGSGVALTLAISEGPPTRITQLRFDGEPGLPTQRLSEVLGISPGAVLNRDRLDAGLDQLRALFRARHYYRAKVGEARIRSDGAGAEVVVPISAGPRMRFAFRFNHAFPDDVLAGILGYDGSEALDHFRIDRLARKVEAFYRYHGYLDARVHPSVVSGPKGRNAVVVFALDEGAPTRIATIAFDGNHALPDAVLRAIVETNVAGRIPVPTGDVHPNDDPLELEGRVRKSTLWHRERLSPGQVFVDEAYRAAAEEMEGRYHALGYLSAKVRLGAVRRDERAGIGTVRFEVNEGPQAIIREVSDDGLPEGFTPPASKAISPGTPLDRTAVAHARAALVSALSHRGWMFAEVTPHVALTAGDTRAEIRFEVAKGPRVHVGQVILRGLKHTDPGLVRANLGIARGDVLDPEKLFDAQKTLVALGIFRQVNVRLIEPDQVEPTKDVVVELKERPRLSGEIGPGYSLADGPRLVGNVLYPDFLGRGIHLTFNGKVNYVGASALAFHQFGGGSLSGFDGVDGRGNLSLQQPRIYGLLPLKIGARVDLIGERIHRPAYRFSRFAAVAGVDWAAAPWLQVSLQYEIENDRVRAGLGIEQLLPSLDRADAERLRFPVGNFTLQSVGPSVTLDFRDQPVNPHRGLLVALSGEVTKDLGAVRTDAEGHPLAQVPIFNFKATANVTGYVPIAPRVTLALSARGGRIFPLDPQSETIAPKRFFMGGALSLRGFSEDALIPQDRREDLHQELAHCRALTNPAGCTPAAMTLASGGQLPSEGGELFTLFKAELRFPLVGAFGMGLFGEAGNLWLTTSRYQPWNLRWVAGAGLRYVTPVGALALDLGFNLKPDRLLDESLVAVHFSVGLF